MTIKPRLRDVARRRALRERAAGVQVSKRLAALLALSIARWGYRLSFSPRHGNRPRIFGHLPRPSLQDTYAWADMQAQGQLAEAEYRAHFERAVAIYDHILVRHLPAGEDPRGALPEQQP